VLSGILAEFRRSATGLFITLEVPVLAGDSSGAHGYQGYPLTGSPARRLQDHTARLLGRGAVPRCPHPDQPVFWFLAIRTLACAPCTGELLGAAGGGEAACQACGQPASAVAAWMVGDVPCIADLCDGCHTTGLVPLAPN
jgi:hypothetical protein